MLILPASLKLFLLYVSGCLACCVPGLHACACAGQKRTSCSLELGSQIIVSHHVDSGDWTLVLEKAASPLKPWVIFIIFSIWMCQLFLPSVTFFLQLGWVYWKCFILFFFFWFTTLFISSTLLSPHLYFLVELVFHVADILLTSLILSFTLFNFPFMLSVSLSSPVLSASVCFCLYSLSGQSSFFLLIRKPLKFHLAFCLFKDV